MAMFMDFLIYFSDICSQNSNIIKKGRECPPLVVQSGLLYLSICHISCQVMSPVVICLTGFPTISNLLAALSPSTLTALS